MTAFEESLAGKGFDRDAANVSRVYTRGGTLQHVIMFSGSSNSLCMVCRFRPAGKTGWKPLSQSSTQLPECKERKKK